MYKQLGISIAARNYDFDEICPFLTSDVLDLQPVVKHSVPVCLEAKDLIETGKLRLAEVLWKPKFQNNLFDNV